MPQIQLPLPGSLLLFAVINTINDNDNDNDATLPPLWQLGAVVLGTVLVVAVLTAVPARAGAREPVAETLRNEMA